MMPKSWHSSIMERAPPGSIVPQSWSGVIDAETWRQFASEVKSIKQWFSNAMQICIHTMFSNKSENQQISKLFFCAVFLVVGSIYLHRVLLWDITTVYLAAGIVVLTFVFKIQKL
jgi:hypothetical protein